MGVRWSRPEAFGAWVRFDDATLVAVDRVLAGRLGVVGAGARGATRPLELHVAVTARCPAGCAGCYVDAQPDGFEPSFDVLRARLVEARDLGASTVAFGGGEPLVRRDIGQLASEARALGLVPVMTTSGIGLTLERAAELKAFAQVNVSHDGVGGAYERVRGFSGGAVAERAIALLVEAGVAVGVNLVLTRASFEEVAETSRRVADLGARELQLLRYKPAGRAAGLAYYDRRLTPEQVARLWPTIVAVVGARRLGVRIDCAMVPLLSGALVTMGAEEAARRLEALGVFGCEAARYLGAERADGSVAPCSFSHADGSAADESADATLAVRWERDGELERFRGYHATLESTNRAERPLERASARPDPCGTCPLVRVCRGGCQVVTRHATGAFGPDPECPRVRGL